jgi:hypothetical protein
VAQRLSIPPLTGLERFMVEVRRRRRFRAMELITILKRCHRFRGFVYEHARFSTDKKSIERLRSEIAVFRRLLGFQRPKVS